MAGTLVDFWQGEKHMYLFFPRPRRGARQICQKSATMKPKNVSSVLLFGPPNTNKSSFLMQGAVCFAEEGYAVAYISNREVECLPPLIHGLPAPGPDVFSLIRFLYLPRWQDLLQHLFSLHLHAQVPSVLIVEALDHYCITKLPSSPKNDDSESPLDASHAALVCAALLDAASVCAQHNKSVAHLIASFSENQVSCTKIHPIIDIFFTDTVWLIERGTVNSEDENEAGCSQKIKMTRFDVPGTHRKQFQIEFVNQPGNSTLVMTKVLFLCKNKR